MKLLMFEHCSLCFRVRMVAALKGIHLAEHVVEDDDSAAMVDLVGRRVIPILVLDDGTPMLESWDMVDHLDRMGPPILTGPERPAIRLLPITVLHTGTTSTLIHVVAVILTPQYTGRMFRTFFPYKCSVFLMENVACFLLRCRNRSASRQKLDETTLNTSPQMVRFLT